MNLDSLSRQLGRAVRRHYLHSAVADAVLRQARDLDRQADLALSVGRHAAAERLAHQAFEMREAAR